MRRRLLRIRRRIRTIAIAAGLALAGVAALALLTASSLVRASPSWWRHYALDPELRDHATAVENAAISQLYRTRPADPDWQRDPGDAPWRSAPWSIALKDEDASAWLTARLRDWMEGEADRGRLDAWPEGLGQPQVRFEAGRLRLGAALRFENGSRVISAAIEPEFRDDGSLWLDTDWITIGRLPLPAGPVLARADRAIRDELPGDIAQAISDDAEQVGFFDILRGEAPLARTPVLRLDDGRAVRLLGLRLRDGRLEVDCQTVARQTAARD
jgi:hypothetical protein